MFWVLVDLFLPPHPKKNHTVYVPDFEEALDNQSTDKENADQAAH